ncbi:efflux RND transporter periplasmic adaptor subunit [Pelagicoccus mobilis]|uniref:Efflux RND transporter periplasmic adaptor subunit n=1 Tax=Pelagicoccus mobilis TaxID=415221 RepID=A0A934RZ13_9BACT|nr:efflux RND transporter periplasmic adaptor subunit [Pelagicoccus mobilis]MBK1878130.1 efflux RND transporter periplasmic adaptor subunit [Pelagicoccus mobilis]
MNKQVAIALGVLTIGATFWAGRCSAPDNLESGGAHSRQELPSEPESWTCSMHPQIQQAEFGACPICGMDLIPAGDDSVSADSGHYRMSPAARALAEVETVEVERRMPETSIRLVGTLQLDETMVRSITARFPARIEELFVNYRGVPVKKGEHLASIYSPELLSAQKELLLAYERHGDGAFVESARQKLRRWGLEEDQIDLIRDRGESSDQFELRAPFGGVVSKKLVREGDYLDEGNVLFEIADYSRLWLMLDAYESDLAWLRIGQELEFTVKAYPSEVFTGRIVFISPEVDRESRTTHLRVNVSNPKGVLKPGMFATGQVKALVTKGGGVFAPDLADKWISPMHPEIVKDGPGSCDVCGMDLVPASELGYTSGESEEVPLIVPSSAVMRTGERSIVYVESESGEDRLYEGREVLIGQKAGEFFTIVSGLEEGERVVSRGAFKIDSALQILAKPSMMSPAKDEQAGADDAPVLNVEAFSEGLGAYLDLQEALAGDDFESAARAVESLHVALGHDSALSETIHGLMEAKDIAAMRRPYFDDLSKAFIATAEGGVDFEGTELARMRCPMVYPNNGAADWLQRDGALRNPYFGAMMLTCGEKLKVYGEE